GAYTVSVADAPTGDQGRAAGSITSQGQATTVNVVLNGVGAVVVTVADGGGQPVSGALVTVASGTVFGGSSSGTTLQNGSATFNQVLAGPFTVRASNPATARAGTATGTVSVGGTTNLTLQLQAAGSVLGTVSNPDGTPAINITLTLDVYGAATVSDGM